jgi:hypothetical protein
MVELERLITDACIARGVLIVVTSVLANSNILRSGSVVAERADADRCVLKSSRADNHCAVAYGRISVTAGIAKEGAFPYGRVERTGGVAFQRLIPNGCVIAPTGIAIESKRTRRCVEARGIIEQRCVSIGGVTKTAYIAVKGRASSGRVGAAICVVKEGTITHGRVVEATVETGKRSVALSRIAVAQVSVRSATHW